MLTNLLCGSLVFEYVVYSRDARRISNRFSERNIFIQNGFFYNAFEDIHKYAPPFHFVFTAIGRSMIFLFRDDYGYRWVELFPIVFTLSFFLLLGGNRASSQIRRVDSLKQLLEKTPPSVKRIDINLALADFSGTTEPKLLEEAVRLADSLKEMMRLKDALNFLGEAYIQAGKIDEAEKCFQRSIYEKAEIQLENQRIRSMYGMGLVYAARHASVQAREQFEQSLKLAESARDTTMIARSLLGIGKLYMNQKDDENARSYYRRSIALSAAIQKMPVLAKGYGLLAFLHYKRGEFKAAIEIHERALDIYTRMRDSIGMAGTLSTMGMMYDRSHEPEKAITLMQRSFSIYQSNGKTADAANALMNIGLHYRDHNQYPLALEAFNKVLTVGDRKIHWYAYSWIGDVYEQTKEYRKAIDAFQKELEVSGAKEMLNQRSDALRSLYHAYESVGDTKNAYRSVLRYLSVKDSLAEMQNTRQLNDLNAKYENARHQHQIETLEKDNLLKDALLDKATMFRNIIVASFVVALVFIGALYQRYRYKKRTTEQLSTMLDELKRTQQQLIHSEKMATLGELTAGIAHEIKNPLNFINNFSELSSELVEELIAAEGDEKIETIEMLRNNLSKIHHHGRRADSIIQSMMQHARGGMGEHALTDINRMLEENINLVYHGMKAQNPSFDVSIRKSLDSSLKEIVVMPQELSRVIINLMTNALYAVKKKAENAANGYQPSVDATTRQTGDAVEIRIRDNGTGIPEEIRAKIFQPFFTTKPTGEGTGLGLSMSYDIIVNGHGGTLTCENSGEGAEFVITIPSRTTP